MLRGRHGGIAGSPWNDDSRCPRHQHPDFRHAESARTALAGVFLMTILEPDTQLWVSGDIYAEYEEVIRVPFRLKHPAFQAKLAERILRLFFQTKFSYQTEEIRKRVIQNTTRVV
jgi:hypothetical protein